MGIGKNFKTKIEKRKYNKGEHFIKGSWMFGCFERDCGRQFLISVVTSHEMLLFIMKEHVFFIPEMTVLSDCWHTYNCL